MPRSTPPAPSHRAALRQTLLAARQAWSSDTAKVDAAQAALHGHLLAVLAELEPDGLGLYWPIRGEFDPRGAALAWLASQSSAQHATSATLALPWARRASAGQAPGMSYRRWAGEPLSTKDECGIPSPEGAPASPDVLLVPCVGFTRDGLRLGYGGGYFDRYLAAHPDVTAVGLAWAEAELTTEQLPAQAHDQPLMLVITPQGVVG